MIWYGLTEKEILHALGATENGLSGEEAGRRLAQYGPNRLVEEEK